MKFIKKKLLVLIGLALLLFLLPNPGLSNSVSKDSIIVFQVAWYDVGKAALEGLPGVKNVINRFKGAKEVNIVTYDSSQISIEKMAMILKKVKTYQGILK